MIQHPNISPYIFEMGVIKPTWYGLMYVVALVVALNLAQVRAKKNPAWSTEAADSLVINYLALGAVLGGRIGYVLFYGLSFWAKDPFYPIKIWHGGMSFHGGLIGVIIACLIFAHRRGMAFYQVTDFLAPLIPPGLLFGRIGNFINSELWGKQTDLPWGVLFPNGGPLPRHPSQLYEGLLEGFVLFFILWLYSTKQRAFGRVSGLFLVGYGTFRFIVEFVRVPDKHLGYLALPWLTMGQILSIPMIVFGLYLMLRPTKS